MTPLALLKQEASYLGPKTRQLVKAEVRTAPTNDGRFAQNFFIVAPGLSNYQYQLFQLFHPITLYPAQLIYRGALIGISGQDELTTKLREILGSRETKQIVEALLAQVSGVTADQQV